MSQENLIDLSHLLTNVLTGPIKETATLTDADPTTLICQMEDQIQIQKKLLKNQIVMLPTGILVESALTICLKVTEKDVQMTALTLTVSSTTCMVAPERNRTITENCLGNTDDLVYFEWTDMIEGETLTVQVKEPCADGYIHPEWVGDSYLDFIKAEMMDDCLEGCDDSDNAEVCATKCKALTPRGKGDSVSHI